MKRIISLVMALAMTFSVNTFADSKYNINVNEILKTNRNVSEYNTSFLSVTGYAEGVVNDRTKYIGTDYYREVSNGDEFVAAIEDAAAGKVKVIEITNDINLGYYELSEESQNAHCVDLFDDPASAFSTGKYTNPTLKQSGVTKLSINKTNGLTIFSKTGNCIRHAEFKLQYGSSDIIFRNLEFDDMWQWDEAGTHKEVGWSFFKINGAKNVWIDHCTFSIAADALIDLENASSGVTYQWCRFSKTADTPEKYDPIYKTITYMEYLYQNDLVAKNGRYYKLRNKNIEPEILMQYEAFHSKCFGVGNEKQFKDMETGNMPEDSSQRVRLTMAYNYLTNVGQRIPRLSFGRAHMFNLYIDNESHELLQKKNSTLTDLGGVSLRANQCIDVHTAGSCAADTCVFNYVDKPMCGNEYQGEYGGTGLSSDPVLSHCWRDAKNRALIINSKVTNSKGQTYTGSSWDNNGDNLLVEPEYWEIEEWQTVIGKPKATIGNWAWASNIVGVENLERENPGSEPFVFEDDYEAELGYDYQVLPLDEVEEVVSTYAGAYVLEMSEKDWLRVSYDENEKGIKFADKSKKVKATEVNIRQEGQKVGLDELIQLDADVTPGNVTNRNVIWSSSDQDIIEVLDSGLCIVKKQGVVNITATAADGSGKSDSITLKVVIPVEKIRLNYLSEDLEIGKRLCLIHEISPKEAYNKSVIYSSSNEDVAKVDVNGIVTALAEGSTMIYCTSKENSNIKAAVTLRVVQSESEAYTELVYDVNGDGMTDAADALVVLKHLAGIDSLEEEVNADALEIVIRAAKL